MVVSSPFGSRSRTRILMALRGQQSSYPRALARLLDTPIFAVRKALAGLEQDGLVTCRQAGRTRVYTLNPSYVAYRELSAYLGRLAQADGWLPQAPTTSEERRSAAPGRLIEPSHLATRSTPPEGAGPARPPEAPRSAAGAERGRSSPRTSDDGWRNW